MVNSKTIKFVVEIPDTEANARVCEELGDMIAVADDIATAIGDLGFDNVKVKEY